MRLYDLPPGDYWLVAKVFEQWANLMAAPEEPVQADQQLVYAPVYYAGTTLLQEAQPLTLAAGQQATVSLALMPWRTTRLHGRMLNADGTPARGQAVLNVMQENGTFNAKYRADLTNGTFTFPDLLPGEYLLEKQIADPPAPHEEYGWARLTITGAPEPDLVINTAPPGRLRGRIVFDTGVQPPEENGEPWDHRLFIYGTLFGDMYAASIAPDLTFALPGVLRPVTFNAGGGDWAGWMLKSVTRDGVDVTSVPLTSADDLQVVLTHSSSVRGTVLDDHGVAVVRCPVVVFAAPDDREPRHAPHLIKSDERGQYWVGDLLPGDYFAVALDREPLSHDQLDAKTLRHLETQATRFTIGDEGGGIEVNVPLTLRDPQD
jgi:hypothetical protein